MLIAKIYVSGVQSAACEYTAIPVGVVGAEVEFEFDDPRWDGLTKTAVFKAGQITRDATIFGNIAIVPPETVATEGVKLLIGVFGSSGDSVQIPTLWATAGMIRDAADPSGDPGTAPSLPIWAQLQERVEALEKRQPINPDAPDSPGVNFKTDETLTLENGVLSVNTTNDMEQDNTLPITSAGVYATVGNIEALLKTI